ncbi:hypothetical protein [Curtobacterium sp. VKM Ac-1376]|uniref:hypothetical protein n=1 Tax=Curtobacterium sp. VKM Ac-1376 TaxID=123312 RepID=UPI00188A6C41|nr:hypothetical protein [Curtobacterium sp. VKM Ac-1376]MBF4612970.1 hypothetical protein [Curtobacterium sp. VKM Ac-1376]
MASTSSRPTSVAVSFVIWLVVVLANILQGIIGLVSGGSSSAAQDVGTAPLVGGAASGGNAFGWIGGVAVLIATILMYVGGANGYFRRH